jgi:hypothetical protein
VLGVKSIRLAGKITKLKSFLLDLQTWRRFVLSALILIIWLFASIFIQYLSDIIAPHKGSVIFNLALRGMLEFSFVMGLVTSVALLIEDYLLSGSEFFGTPMRTVWNIFYLPFGCTLLFLFPSFLLFGACGVLIPETVVELVLGPYWDFSLGKDAYLLGAAATVWLPVYAIYEFVWARRL